MLLQVVLSASLTQSTITQPAIFEAGNIGMDGMHILLQSTCVHSCTQQEFFFANPDFWQKMLLSLLSKA